MRLHKILLFLVFISLIFQVSFSLEGKNKVEEVKSTPAVELMPNIEKTKNENNNNNNLDTKNENENVENVNQEVAFEFHEVSFEDNLKKIINDIVSITNRNREEDITSLLNYIFGQNASKKQLQEQQDENKQSKFDQMKEYYQSLSEIAKTHKYEIDHNKVRQISHDLADVYGNVFKLNQQEQVQYENNIKNFLDFAIKKVLGSFGLSENKPLYELNGQLEKDVHDILQHYGGSKKFNEKLSSVTDKNIEQFAHAIVQFSENNSKFLNGFLEKLDVKDASIEKKEANVSAVIKVTMRVLYSLMQLFGSSLESAGSSLQQQSVSSSVVNKLPTWISQANIEDINSIVDAEELFNPRTVIAFNKLFVRENEPISKYEQDQLTHQFIDLGYSILYGRQQKYEKFSEKNEKIVDSNVDSNVLNRIINLADKTEDISQQDSLQGEFIRAARSFFGLFHIVENYDQYEYGNFNEEDTELEQHQLENFEQQQQQQENQQENQQNENAQGKDQINQEQPSNIQYIAHRVNKLIEQNPDISKDDQFKRTENVFRILYNIYLHYYGLEDQNQLESNKKVSKKITDKEHEEVAFIREIVPSLTENDVVDILQEIDRAAEQLGYRVSNAEEDEQEQHHEEEVVRDLGIFEYPETD